MWFITESDILPSQTLFLGKTLKTLINQLQYIKLTKTK